MLDFKNISLPLSDILKRDLAITTALAVLFVRDQLLFGLKSVWLFKWNAKY